MLAFSKTSLLLSLKKTRSPKFLQGTMKWKDYVTQTFIYALARLLTWKLGLTQRNLHSFEFKFAHPNENVIFFWSPNWVHWKIGPINVTVGLIRNALLFWLNWISFLLQNSKLYKNQRKLNKVYKERARNLLRSMQTIGQSW